MSSQDGYQKYGERGLPDYLRLTGFAFYGLFGVAFVVGLFLDWWTPGVVVVPPFVIAHEPQPNSGMFVLSFVLLVVGYLFSRSGDVLEARRIEEVDQTQEWEVDVGSGE